MARISDAIVSGLRSVLEDSGLWGWFWGVKDVVGFRKKSVSTTEYFDGLWGVSRVQDVGPNGTGS